MLCTKSYCSYEVNDIELDSPFELLIEGHEVKPLGVAARIRIILHDKVVLAVVYLPLTQSYFISCE